MSCAMFACANYLVYRCCHSRALVVAGSCQTALLLHGAVLCGIAYRCEYGEAEVTLELVDSMDEAIDHLHAHGSGHTECIVTGVHALQHLSEQHKQPCTCKFGWWWHFVSLACSRCNRCFVQ